MNVCFFDEEGNQVDCVALREVTAFVWHGLVRHIKPGQRYGYRVDGPWNPEAGLRFNAAKLLLDPYAKAITGQHADESKPSLPDPKGPIYPYDVQSGDDLKKDDTDDAAFVPKSIVVSNKFDWEDDCWPQTPIADSIIYEVHVRGFSKLTCRRSCKAPMPA